MHKIFIFTILLILSACAQKKIVLQSSEITPLKQLDSNMPVSKVSGSLTVLSFSDRRVKTDSVGIAKTGIVNAETPIYLDVSVEEYVKGRFVAGLSKRGVDVVARSKYGIKGNIRKLWVLEQADGLRPEHSKCEVEIEFDIIAMKNKDLRYHGVISSNAMGTDSIFDTTASNGPLLEVCMTYVVEKFVQEPQVQSLLGFSTLK